jgi:hypothetical protein
LRLKRVYGDGELLYRPVINTLKGGEKIRKKLKKMKKNDKKNDKKKTNTAYG